MQVARGLSLRLHNNQQGLSITTTSFMPITIHIIILLVLIIPLTLRISICWYCDSLLLTITYSIFTVDE